MIVYVLTEQHQYEGPDILGVYLSADDARKQIDDATWGQPNDHGFIFGYRRIGSWSDETYLIEPHDTDQPAPKPEHPLYTPTPEEIEAEHAPRPPGWRGGVQSMGAWPMISASIYQPTGTTAEHVFLAQVRASGGDDNFAREHYDFSSFSVIVAQTHHITLAPSTGPWLVPNDHPDNRNLWIQVPRKPEPLPEPDTTDWKERFDALIAKVKEF